MSEQFDHQRFQRRLTAMLNRTLTRINLSSDASVVYSAPELMQAYQIKYKNQPTGNNANASISLLRKSNPQLKQKKAQGLVAFDSSAALFMTHDEYVSLMKSKGSQNSTDGSQSKEEESVQKELSKVERDLAWMSSTYELTEHRTEYDRQVKSMVQAKRNGLKQNIALFGLKMFFSSVLDMLKTLPMIENSEHAPINLQSLIKNLKQYSQSLLIQNSAIHLLAIEQISSSILPAFLEAILNVKALNIKVLLLEAVLAFLKLAPTCQNWGSLLNFLAQNHQSLKLSSRNSLMKQISNLMLEFKASTPGMNPEIEGPQLDKLITREKVAVAITGIKTLDDQFKNHKSGEVESDGSYFYYLIGKTIYVIGTGLGGTMLGVVYQEKATEIVNATMCLFKEHLLVLGMKKNQFTIIPLFGHEPDQEKIQEIDSHLKSINPIKNQKRGTLFKVRATGDQLHFFLTSNQSTYNGDVRRLRWELYDKNAKRIQQTRLNFKTGSSISISTNDRKNWSFFAQGDMIILQQRASNQTSRLIVYQSEKGSPKVDITLPGSFSCLDLSNRCLWQFSSDTIQNKDQASLTHLTFQKVWNPIVTRSLRFSGITCSETRSELQDALDSISKMMGSSPNYDTLIIFLISRMAQFIEQRCSYAAPSAYMSTQGVLSLLFQPFGDFSAHLFRFIAEDLKNRLSKGIPEPRHQILILYCEMLIVNQLVERAIRIKEYNLLKNPLTMGLFQHLLSVLLSSHSVKSFLLTKFLKQIERFIAVNLVRLHIPQQIQQENNWSKPQQILTKLAGNLGSPKTDSSLALMDQILQNTAQSLSTANIEMGRGLIELSQMAISDVFSVGIRTMNEKVLRRASGAIVFSSKFSSVLISALYYKHSDSKQELFMHCLRKCLEQANQLLRVGYKASKAVNNQAKVIQILRFSRVVANLIAFIRVFKVKKIELHSFVGLLLPMLEVKALLERFIDEQGEFVSVSDSLGWLIGKVFQGLLQAKHIQKMPKPNLFAEQMELDERVALVQTVQYLLSSKLFSGGIQLSRIGHLSQELMEKIKSLGIFSDSSLELVEPVLTSQGSYEEGSKLESLINSGIDQTVDQFLSALQADLIKVDPRARVGARSGDQLARYAFAGMLKFSGLLGEFQTLMSQISLGLFKANDLVSIKQQNSMIMKKLEQKWATASQMRAWLQGQRNKFGEKGESDTYLAEREKELVNKVRERIEFLLRFQKPQIWDLEEDKEEKEGQFQAPILVRAESSADKSRSESIEVEPGADEPQLVAQHSSSSLRKNSYSGVILHHSEEELKSLESKIEYWTHKIKDWKLIQKSKGLVKNFQIRQKEMFSSLTTSVLAYLQADIPVDLIQHQIHLNYLVICERIFVFEQLYQFLHQNRDIEFSRFRNILNSYLAYFQQQGGPKHFLRGLKGYGQEISSLLQAKFFQVIDVVIDKLHSSKNVNDCKVMVDFLNWNYSARDHKDVLKRGIFSSLVGSRPSMLSKFWLSQDILQLASKQQPIGPLVQMANSIDFANKLYSTFFEMAEQIVIRALSTREGGLESVPSMSSASSSLKMPSLDRYQSSIDQNSTESLLNWILNFSTVQVVKMAKLLEFFQIPLQSKTKKIPQVVKQPKEPFESSEEQSSEVYLRSLFDSEQETSAETQQESKQNLPIVSSYRNLLERHEVLVFCQHYLGQLCSFFQRVSLLVQNQEQSLPFQCLLKYVAPKFISALLGLLFRSPHQNAKGHILGCLVSMLKIFPIEMFHEAVRLTLQKEEIAKFLYEEQNRELKLLTSSLFSVVYKFALKFQVYLHRYASEKEKPSMLRTLASMKELLRFYIAEINHDEIDFLQEQISHFQPSNQESMLEGVLILEVLGGQLRSFSVGQEVFIRRYQDIPLERRGFIVSVNSTEKLLKLQEFTVLVGGDCLSCKPSEFELVQQSSSTRISELLRFRSDLLMKLAQCYSRVIQASQNQDKACFNGTSLPVLVRIAKLFEGILKCQSDYAAPQIQETLLREIKRYKDALPRFRISNLEHLGSSLFEAEALVSAPELKIPDAKDSSFEQIISEAVKSLPDVSGKFVLHRHQVIQNFFPQLDIIKDKIFPEIQGLESQIMLTLHQKLLIRIFFILLTRDSNMRASFLQTSNNMQFLLSQLYEVFKLFSQCPNYEPDQLALVFKVFQKVALNSSQVVPALLDIYSQGKRRSDLANISIALIGHFIAMRSPESCFQKVQGKYFFHALVVCIMKLSDHPLHPIFHRGMLHKTVAHLFHYLLLHSNEILEDLEFCQKFNLLYPKRNYASKCLSLQDKLGLLADPIHAVWTEIMRYLLIVHYRINSKYPFISVPNQWASYKLSKGIRKFLLSLDTQKEPLSFQQEWESETKKTVKDLQFYAYDCTDKIVLNHHEYSQFAINDLAKFIGLQQNSKVVLTRSQEREHELEPEKTQPVNIEEGGAIQVLHLNKKSKLVIEVQDDIEKKFTERKGPKCLYPDYNQPQIIQNGVSQLKLAKGLFLLLMDDGNLYIGFQSNQFKLMPLYKGVHHFSIVSSVLILASSERNLIELSVKPEIRALNAPVKHQLSLKEGKFQILSFPGKKLVLYNKEELVLARLENELIIEDQYELHPGTKIIQSNEDLFVVEDSSNIFVFDNLQQSDAHLVRAPFVGVKQIFSLKNSRYVVLFQNGKIFHNSQDHDWEEVSITLFSPDSRISELQSFRSQQFFYAFQAISQEEHQRRVLMKEMNDDILQKKAKAKGKATQGLLEWKKTMMQKKKAPPITESNAPEEEQKHQQDQPIAQVKANQGYIWVYRVQIDSQTEVCFYDKINKSLRLRDYSIQGSKILRILEKQTTAELKNSNIHSLLVESLDKDFDYIFCHQIEKNREGLGSMVDQIKGSLSLEEKEEDWLYHCLCKDFNRDYKFTLSQKHFEIYKVDIFQTLPLILIRSKHPLKPTASSLIQLYSFYNSTALGKDQMSHILPQWPMFQIFKEPRAQDPLEEVKHQTKDYSKLDSELHRWIVKIFQKNRIRVNGSLTIEGGIKALAKGFSTLLQDLDKNASDGFSQLQIQERVRSLFFRSYRCMNLLCFANFRELRTMPESSITGILAQKKLPQTMFFYKQAFLRAMMNGAKRGNSLGMITLDRFMSHSFARRGIQDTTGSVTVFGQVMNKIDSKSDRYTSLMMNRASQNAWQVRFAGEKGIDAGGLTRESIDELSNELQSPQLPLLIKTPNNRNEYGEQREKWILNPSSRSLRELEMFRFLGGMLASSIRGEKKMILDLAGLFYKKLLNLEVTDSDLKNVDNYCVKSLEDIQNLIQQGGLNIEDLFEEKFVTCLSNGEEVELMQTGRDILLTNDNVTQYESLVKSTRKNQSDRQMKALKAGFELVFDSSLISYFSPQEIEILVCGSPQITVQGFQAITQNPFNNPMKKKFWEVFEELSQTYRAKYLRFAWGRSRLPHSDINCRTQGAQNLIRDCQLGIHGENQSEVSFFSVDMPNYSTKEIMKERILYTLNNCQAIDGDGGSFVAFFDDEM